jgi:hypothetical protein
MQNIWKTPFSRALWRGRGGCETNWPTVAMEIATLYEFDENDRRIYESHFKTFFYTFHYKKDTKDGFEENA